MRSTRWTVTSAGCGPAASSRGALGDHCRSPCRQSWAHPVRGPGALHPDARPDLHDVPLGPGIPGELRGARASPDEAGRGSGEADIRTPAPGPAASDLGPFRASRRRFHPSTMHEAQARNTLWPGLPHSERATAIEPAYLVWKTKALPLSYARTHAP